MQRVYEENGNNELHTLASSIRQWGFSGTDVEGPFHIRNPECPEWPRHKAEADEIPPHTTLFTANKIVKLQMTPSFKEVIE